MISSSWWLVRIKCGPVHLFLVWRPRLLLAHLLLGRDRTVAKLIRDKAKLTRVCELITILQERCDCVMPTWLARWPPMDRSRLMRVHGDLSANSVIPWLIGKWLPIIVNLRTSHPFSLRSNLVHSMKVMCSYRGDCGRLVVALYHWQQMVLTAM